MSDPHIESTTVLSDIIFVCVYMNVWVRVRECVCTTLCVCVCTLAEDTDRAVHRRAESADGV